MEIMSVLMLGMGSAALITTRAMPNGRGQAKNILVNAEVADRMMDELGTSI